jgi:uncharacterized protein (TIGR02757 family)
MNPAYDPLIADFLESIYLRCNARNRLVRDPLAIVLQYHTAADREVAGLVCSCLAFGSVDLIMSACKRALKVLGDSPATALGEMTRSDIYVSWENFQYRFCFPSDMIGIMQAISLARKEYGSLEALFSHGDRGNGSIIEPLSSFVRAIRSFAGDGGHTPSLRPNLLPDPLDKSACKRLFLYLRWMVRNDDIDPGGWDSISPARLIVPLDTHMVATCRERLGFLDKTKKSSQPTLKDALAVTSQFALYSPDDPVKYDFALTRPGIDPMPGDEVFACL